MEITNFYLEKWYVEYEFKSKYNLSASGIKPLNLSQTLNETDNLNDTLLTYSQAQGNDDLIRVLAKNNNVSESNILVTNGAIEGLFLTQLSLFDKGDNVIVIKPAYPALYQIAQDLGANIIDWELDFNNEFKPDFEKLDSLMKQNNPKALIINFPNNPTGSTLTYQEKIEIVELCKKYNCYLISDEVYSNLDLNKTNENENLTYEKKIIIDSLSKTYGLAGLRIGWVISDKEIINKMINLRHYTTLCNNVLSEKIAFNVLNNKEKYINTNLKLLKTNRDITYKYLDRLKDKNKIDYIKPSAGLMIFVKLKNADDTEDFCRDFEDKTSILLLPGKKYSHKYSQFFRLGFGIDTETLIFCLEKLEEYIN